MSLAEPATSLAPSAIAAVIVLAACHPVQPRDRIQNGGRIDDGSLRAPAGPKYPEATGKDALRRWVDACRRRGLTGRPEVFGRPGVVVVLWAADRRGDLLRLEFSSDSYRGWDVAPGLTLADCVVARARQGKIRWSRRGTAPMRLAAVGPKRAPASEPASQATSPPAGGE